jgi:arsenite oxidase large subunit
MDRMPYPYIQMNPDDMTDLKLKQSDLVEVYNDNSSTQAMAYPTPTAKRKQTHAVRLSHQRAGRRGVGRGQRVRDPNYKQTWGAIHQVADAPERKHLSFKSLEYTG